MTNQGADHQPKLTSVNRGAMIVAAEGLHRARVMATARLEDDD